MRIWEKIRKLGWRRFTLKALSLLFGMIWRRDFVFIARRPSEAQGLPRRGKSLAFVPMTAANIRENATAFSYKADLFQQRIDEGLYGYFILDADQEILHGYHWLVMNRDYRESFYRYTFPIKAGEGYILDGYIKPEYRGQTSALQGLHYSMGYMRNYEVHTVYSAFNRANEAAWRFHLHTGFEICSCLEITRILGRPIRAREVNYRSAITREMHAMMDRHAIRKNMRQLTKKREAEEPETA